MSKSNVRTDDMGARIKLRKGIFKFLHGSYSTCPRVHLMKKDPLKVKLNSANNHSSLDKKIAN
jgi:hypothetical protein